MLVECLAPAASGKSTITNKLIKCLNGVRPSQLPKSNSYSEAIKAVAQALNGLKDKVEYYEHRRLLKRFSKRLDLLNWAEKQKQLVFTSMGTLQCLVDLFMMYEDVPSFEQVQNLITTIPFSNIVITIYTNQDILVDRHINRTRNFLREQQIGMDPSEELVKKYISKQQQIISMCCKSELIKEKELCLLNNYKNEKELFSSDWWVALIETIRESTCSQ